MRILNFNWVFLLNASIITKLMFFLLMKMNFFIFFRRNLESSLVFCQLVARFSSLKLLKWPCLWLGRLWWPFLVVVRLFQLLHLPNNSPPQALERCLQQKINFIQRNSKQIISVSLTYETIFIFECFGDHFLNFGTSLSAVRASIRFARIRFVWRWRFIFFFFFNNFRFVVAVYLNVVPFGRVFFIRRRITDLH